MNKCFFIGNLTRDPELRKTKNGDSVGNFTIAVKRDYDNGETDFFKVTAWKGLAEICGKYLKKGSKVSVFGALQNNQYEDKNGNKKNEPEIIASDVEFLSKKDDTADKDEKENADTDLPF